MKIFADDLPKKVAGLTLVAIMTTLMGCDGSELTVKLNSPSDVTLASSSLAFDSSSNPSQGGSAFSASNGAQLSSAPAYSSSNDIRVSSAASNNSSNDVPQSSSSAAVSSEFNNTISSAPPFSSIGSWQSSSQANSTASSYYEFSSWPSSVAPNSVVPSSVAPSSVAPVNYFPETPSRISLEHTITTRWNSQFVGFDIDAFAANTDTGVGYAIDRDLSLLHELNLLNGEISRTVGVPADPVALAYLQSESMIAIVSNSPRLVVLNTADFSLIDTVPFDLPPTQVAMSKAGVIAVSFNSRDESLFLYDMASGKTLASPYAPVDSKFSFVGETLVVTSPSYPGALWRYQIGNGMVDDLGALDFGDIELGAVIGNAENSKVIATDKGHLLDKNTFALLDSVSYGQSTFKRIEFLSDGDYALSVDDQNYIRLFDARTNALDYGVQNDTRRIGSNSSLQSREVKELVVYHGAALAIFKGSFTGDKDAYSITQFVLPPYLTDEPLIAQNNSSASSVASSIYSSQFQSAGSSIVSTSSLGQPISSSSQVNPASSSSASSRGYISTTILPFRPHGIDPQDIRVEKQAGVIYVPDVSLSTDLGVSVYGIDIVDLVSGQWIGAIFIGSTEPASYWAANEDLTEFWFNRPVGDSASMFNCVNQQSDCTYHFRAATEISDMFVAGDFIFALGVGKQGLYQFNKLTGELIATVDTGVLDDWLVLPKRKLMYTLENSQVRQYDFSTALYETDLNITADIGSKFGFVSPDESLLYSPRARVIDLSDFSYHDIQNVRADDRRTFVDIAFGSQRNFTLESYGDDNGDAFISALKDYQITPLNIQGQRIFQTDAGVYVYAYKDGEHNLYTIESAPAFLGKGFNDTEIVSRAYGDGINTVRRLLWNFNAHQVYWDDLRLNLMVYGIRDFGAGDHLVIEPFCIQSGCAAGSLTVPIPLSGDDIAVDVKLSDYWSVNDIRALQGVNIRSSSQGLVYSLKNISVSSF